MKDKIHRLVRARWFDLFILSIVLLSVILLMVEIFLPVSEKSLKLIYLLNDTITSLLGLELGPRNFVWIYTQGAYSVAGVS